MYSVVLMAFGSVSPVTVDTTRRHAARAGCQGTVQVAQVQAAGCSGGYAAGYRAPIRSFLHRATAPRTLYHPVTATYIAVPTKTQTAPPPTAPPKSAPQAFYSAPAFRTPVRTFLSCPNGICPRR